VSSPAPPGSPKPLSSLVRFLVLAVAAIGFLFDTYELLMFPVTGGQAIGELLNVAPNSDEVRLWSGRMLWIAALAGGVFGLLGSWLIDVLGRKTVMVASILLYSVSPVAAALSTDLWQLIVFRCTTFIGVCVEAVAAVTWLAELFRDKRSRELAIGWTLAFASVGGILVTEVFNTIVEILKHNPTGLPALPVPEGSNAHAAWRYTLLTGLVPGAIILLLMFFVPESRVWAERKKAGTLKRPSLLELFTPELRRTTVVTTVLSACAYAAAFGALQLGPLVMAPGLPEVEQVKAETPEKVKAATAKVKAAADGSEEKKAAEAELAKAKAAVPQAIQSKRGDMQRWQEIGGLLGRILVAVLLIFLSSRTLLIVLLAPGLVLFPLTYANLFYGEYAVFALAVFGCGLLTVGQFSFISEFLPKVFPVHLRGTGGGFATNVGGRMIGTMAATLNTEFLSGFFPGENPAKVAAAAAVIGGAVYGVGLVAAVFLPKPKVEGEQAA
jgi:MFS family permease